jgi:hypothetical protein
MPSRRVLLLLGILLVGLTLLAFRPVCVPIATEELRQFTVPIEQRADRDFYLKIFQQRHGRWYQCKTWLSRQFFF